MSKPSAKRQVTVAFAAIWAILRSGESLRTRRVGGDFAEIEEPGVSSMVPVVKGVWGKEVFARRVGVFRKRPQAFARVEKVAVPLGCLQDETFYFN